MPPPEMMSGFFADFSSSTAAANRSRSGRGRGIDHTVGVSVFAIFGHGNVTCLSEALEFVQDTLPTWRGQNEQSMALAAIGFAKAKRRRQIMVAASSIGPGATNMVTAAGLAHSNRLPVLLLAGDTFAESQARPGDAAGGALWKPNSA